MYDARMGRITSTWERQNQFRLTRVGKCIVNTSVRYGYACSVDKFSLSGGVCSTAGLLENLCHGGETCRPRVTSVACHR